MGKGDTRRRPQISRDADEAAWSRVFGPSKLNVMPDEERAEFERLKHEAQEAISQEAAVGESADVG